MLDERDWQAIYKAIDDSVTPTEIIFDVVTRRDAKHRIIWTESFGDTPIDLIGFDTNVPVYDVGPIGRIIDPDLDVATVAKQRTFSSNVITPEVGSIVCVIRQFGKNRMPHCIGQALSIVNYDPPDI